MDDQQIRERERLRKNPEQFQQEIVQQQLARMGQMNRASRVLVSVFGLVFFGAGLCMLGLIWGEEASFVPVFAKLFGSLICMAFLAFGGTMVFSAFARAKPLSSMLADQLTATTCLRPPTTAPGTSAPGYQCPFCGAGLGEKADVSPMGDVKCAHCGRWFNVHRNT
jgi:hypothetical protein